METWPEQRQRHKVEQYELVHDAMVRNGWNLYRASKDLGTASAVLRRVIERYPSLSDKFRERKRLKRAPCTSRCQHCGRKIPEGLEICSDKCRECHGEEPAPGYVCSGACGRIHRIGD